MSDIPSQISAAARLLFTRRLLDVAGGNLSCRAGDQIAITCTGAGQEYLWELTPTEILYAPIADDSLLQNPRHSKESISHLLVYRAYPQVQAIIHAHPFHVMAFCAAGMPMPAVIKSTQIYAPQFEHIAELPMYSREQGEEIVARLAPFMEKLDKAAAVLMPQHGVFIAAASLKKALDCLERLDTNAYAALALRWLTPEGALYPPAASV